MNAEEIVTKVAIKLKLTQHEVVQTCEYYGVITCHDDMIVAVLSEWCSMVGGGRRLEEVCVWITAVVDRLVIRNTMFTETRCICFRAFRLF